MKEFIDIVNPALQPDIGLLAELEERAITLWANEQSKFLYPRQLQESFFFVKEGVVRSYTIIDGVEFTDWFFSPGDIAFYYPSLYYNHPSEVWLEATCPTVIIQLHKEDLYYLANKYHFFKRLMNELVCDFHRRKQKHQYFLSSLKASERYRLFSEQCGYINLRTQVKHVASFLGIHPDNLSRIRK